MDFHVSLIHCKLAFFMCMLVGEGRLVIVAGQMFVRMSGH